MAKTWVTEMEGRVCDACLQLHGGYGFLREHPDVPGAPAPCGPVPIGVRFVDARVQRIYGGSNETMRQLVAQRLGFDWRRALVRGRDAPALPSTAADAGHGAPQAAPWSKL